MILTRHGGEEEGCDAVAHVWSERPRLLAIAETQLEIPIKTPLTTIIQASIFFLFLLLTPHYPLGAPSPPPVYLKCYIYKP